MTLVDRASLSPRALWGRRFFASLCLTFMFWALAGPAAAQDNLDFGDAPDASVGPMWSYPTLLVDDGARHLVPASPMHFLGDSPTPFTLRASVNSSGFQGHRGSLSPSISTDGRCVAFESTADNLVSDDTNSSADVFVHDRITGMTTRVSVDSSEGQGNDSSGEPSISADGRYVAFHSFANNLVPGDTNNFEDIFVHDRISGMTTRASLDSSGGQCNDRSREPSISADGRYIAFHSSANNLVSGDSNGVTDVFVHDRTTGGTTRISVDSSGAQSDGGSIDSSISADGRYVAFHSFANNLVPGDTNNSNDLFVHDRTTGETTRASVDSSGGQGNLDSDSASISADGRFVAFTSRSTNLVPGDTNNFEDIFVHDRVTGETTRVSVDSSGGQVNWRKYAPSISADGRYVAFESQARHMVPGDTNSSDDVFVHDRSTGMTTRVSLNWHGGQGNGNSNQPSISEDGRQVAFSSDARNLVSGDTNEWRDVFIRGEYDMIDTDPDGAPTGGASGDDSDGNDDEDGVLFLCCLYPGETAIVRIDASAAGFVNAWIDFNGDGDWGDAGEQILTDQVVASGRNEFDYLVPAAGDVPQTYGRVRFTSYDTVGSLSVTGQAGDGEVEDHRIRGTPLFGDDFESGESTKWSATVQ